MRVLKTVVVVLATSSSFVAEGMEPLAGPLVTQTVMQAGGASRCFVCSFLCLVGILPCLRIIRDDDLRICVFLSEPIPVIVSYDVPQFGLNDELTELKKASLAERDLSLVEEALAGRPSVRRAATFLAKKSQTMKTEPDAGAAAAAGELEGAIEKADAANQMGSGSGEAASLDPAIAATAKKATDLLTSAAFAWDVVTNIHATPEELDVLKQLRSAVQTPSHVGTPEH